MFPDQSVPWWKQLGQVASGVNSGMGGQQQQSNPYAGLGQAAGNFGTALKDKMAQRRASHVMDTDPGLQSGIDDALRTTPQTQAGPEPQVVDRPTLAMIGQDQPEAVVPLTNRPDAKVRPSMAMGRNYYGS
jgi:hypothetical protein